MHEIEITDVLDLHPFAPRDVKDIVEEYLRECVARGFPIARIIHGKGIGAQRALVWSILARSEFVSAFENGPDWGSTVVYFK